MAHEIEEGWVCGICFEVVKDGQPAVRIAADTAVSNGEGGYSSLTNREVLVFALFHSECVMETARSEECDDVEYIEEARDILREAQLCDCCRTAMFGSSRPALTLLRGGMP